MVANRQSREIERLRKVFPKRLAKALELRRMSRSTLAKHLGSHANTVCAYSVGKRFPKVGQLVLIARILEIDLDWLLDIDNAPEPTGVPTKQEVEILEYIQVEVGRGHKPSTAEVGHACEMDGNEATNHVARLLKFKLLQSSGLELTKAGRDLISDSA